MKNYVDPNKNAITLLGFPLVILLLLALIMPKRTYLTLEDLQDRDSLLVHLLATLPEPQNLFQRYLNNWILREVGAFSVMQRFPVSETGVLPK